MTVTILGIDPGTHCGWAVRHQDGNFTSGTWDLSARRHEGGGFRYLRLRSYLQEIIARAKPAAVVYEEVRGHRGTDAAHVYGGIIAVLAEECERQGIPYRGIPVSTVKKLATGKGNADKLDMIAAANARWGKGYSLKDNNEVDARFIAEAGARELR